MIAGGCQNEDALNADLHKGEYLALPQETDLIKMNATERSIFNSAISRLKIECDEDGLLSLSPASHKEAKISKNIYDWIENAIANYNDNLLNGAINTRSDFSYDCESGENEGPTDCVAHAIAGVLHQYNLSYIDSKLKSEYPNGVTIGTMKDALNMFGTVQVIDPQYYSGAIDNAIGVISDGHRAHAVNVFSIMAGIVFYIDYQAIYYDGPYKQDACKVGYCKSLYRYP